jgi:hypothetical protein
MDERKTKWRAPKRQRWTESDGEILLAAINASGSKDGVFAREHGIGRHRIDYWRKRLSVAKPASFVPVEVIDAPATPTPNSSRRVELKLSGGARLVFTGGWDAGSIAPWLDAVGWAS